MQKRKSFGPSLAIECLVLISQSLALNGGHWGRWGVLGSLGSLGSLEAISFV